MRFEKEFTIEPDNSSLLVAEAFGIYSGWKNKILDIILPDTLPEITFITGESGCGKSTLIKQLYPITDIEIPDKPLHSWAKTSEESLRLLSSVGLNDASLFCLRYSNLSDSQQARARIYAALVSGIKVLVIDEFLSTLDRDTAKALAFSFQKIIRREKIQLIAASAHNDIVPFLKPNLLIKGLAFPSRWEVQKMTITGENPFTESLDIVYHKDVVIRADNLKYLSGTTTAGKDLYRKSRLAELHYKGKYLGAANEYIFASYKGKEVGVLVASKKRNWKLNENGTVYKNTGNMRISRVVVHPSYRGCGIGQHIVKTFLDKHKEDKPPVDVVAAMAQFNPIFKKAGMDEIGTISIKPSARLIKTLEENGLSVNDWLSPSICSTFCDNSKKRELLANFAQEFSAFYDPGGIKTFEKSNSDFNIVEYTKLAIKERPDIAARLLWRIRPHTVVKLVYNGTNVKN